MVGGRDCDFSARRMDGRLSPVIDVEDVRARTRRALEARHVYVSHMRSGAPLRYGAAIMASPDAKMFRLVTSSESMPLTAALVRRVAGTVIWAWASTPMIIDDPDPVILDHQPVTEIRGLVMVYPHGPRPVGYSSFDLHLSPEIAEYEPMVIGMLERPQGWPP